jgi:PmbA protein
MKSDKARLEALAQFVIGEAKRLGASDSDVSISTWTSVDTTVRMGDVEKLETAAQGRSLTVRVFVGKVVTTASTSDFTRRALTKVVRSLIVVAKAAQPDEYAGLPDKEDLASLIPDLDLADTSMSKLSVADKIAMAKACEDAALGFDGRINNSQGASFSDSFGLTVYANSRGFTGSYNGSRCSLSCSVVAQQGDSMQTDGWYTSNRKLAKLGTPDSIGQEAARRVLRRLGAVRGKSQEVPVVFDPVMAAQLLGQFAGVAHGSSIYRRTSFLVDKLGEQVACPDLTIIDDGLMPGGLGSRPFNGEGQASRQRTIVDNGKLASYFLDSYSARKLGTRPNGGSQSNLYIKPGTKTPAEIIATVKNGLYLTHVSGPGFNGVTGDYSRGASGIWIENGELAYPVQEITIAGNVLAMLKSVEEIGNDLEFRSSVASPTLKIGSMMIAGK